MLKKIVSLIFCIIMISSGGILNDDRNDLNVKPEEKANVATLIDNDVTKQEEIGDESLNEIKILQQENEVSSTIENEQMDTIKENVKQEEIQDTIKIEQKKEQEPTQSKSQNQKEIEHQSQNKNPTEKQVQEHKEEKKSSDMDIQKQATSNQIEERQKEENQVKEKQTEEKKETKEEYVYNDAETKKMIADINEIAKDNKDLWGENGEKKYKIEISPKLIGQNYMSPYKKKQVEGVVLNVYPVKFLVYAVDYIRTGFTTETRYFIDVAEY